MTQRELDLKAIVDQFSVWEVTLGNLNTLNLQDANLIAEHLIAQVLNCVFGYELKNANSLGKNYPSVDLIDEENRLAIQVTTTSSVAKVRETLTRFTEHGLDKSYDRVMIMVMGKKQKSYPSLSVPSGLDFDPKNDILDFVGLLQVINYLPSAKLRTLRSILTAANKKEGKPLLARKANLQKKALAMEKKFLKDFIDTTLTREELEDAYYEPRSRLNFGSAIIRDVGDRTFPGGDPEQPKWQKKDFCGLYEYGVEFVRQGGEVIFDQDGYWDVLEWDDPRAKNTAFKKVHFWVFYQLSFQDIVVYDLEPDGYHGYPTIFCHFKYDGWPWESIRFGVPGFAHLKQTKRYFDEAKRRTLV